jgi:hypothetical protein
LSSSFCWIVALPSVRDFLLCLFTVPHHRGGTPLAPDAHGAAWRHSFKAGLERFAWQ